MKSKVQQLWQSSHRNDVYLLPNTQLVAREGQGPGLLAAGLMAHFWQHTSHPLAVELAFQACVRLHLQDKTYCAKISVVLKGYRVSNSPAGFPRQVTLPFDVCWYKHNGQATAKFDFGVCGTGTGEESCRPKALPHTAHLLYMLHVVPEVPRCMWQAKSHKVVVRW